MRVMRCNLAGRRPALGAWLSATSAVLALSLGQVGPALAVSVNCADGDGAGWAVAGGGDFDGDGTPDFAVGSPCARASGESQAGRVRVFSGADGRKLLSLKGSKQTQRLGAALQFIGDVDGDDRDDLAVGSSGFDVPKEGIGETAAAGKLEVFSSIDGNAIEALTVLGESPQENRGESVLALGDVDDDEEPDFLVGGGGSKVDGDERGEAFAISGLDGTTAFTSPGERKFDRWSSTMARTGDVDGDGTDDVMVGSGAADADGVPDTGMVKIVSGDAPFETLRRLVGVEDERLGRGIAGAGNVDGADRDDFFIGIPGHAISPGNRVGAVALFSSGGAELWRETEPAPQTGAAYGTTLVSPGDVDGDTRDDVIASAPVGNVGQAASAGRVHALSGIDGELVWSLAGDLSGMRFGQAMASVPDVDGDQIRDILIGAPGDAPRGRRGAGTARLVSGIDGSTIREFRGRRGVETRIVFAGLRAGRRPALRSFDALGRRRELRTDVFRGQTAAELSPAILDEQAVAGVNQLLVAVGSGRGGDGPLVSVWRAGRRGSRVTAPFEAIAGGYEGGVNIAAGELDDGGDDDEIVAAQAESSTGDVEVAVWRKGFQDPLGRILWNESTSFPVFGADDEIEGLEVRAEGAFVAVAPLLPNPPPVEDPPARGLTANLDEIVVGPVAGLPVVRVFSADGTLRAEWLASAPMVGSTDNSGTHVAVGDLDGDGGREIVTAVADGQLNVKAWTATGDPFEVDGGEVNFFVPYSPPTYRGGLRVAVADIDVDGRGEILVAPGGGIPFEIKAFEADGTPVADWKALKPFGPASRGAGGLVATDRFVKP